MPLAQAPAMNPIVEDYSDLAGEVDEQALEDKVANFKVGKPYHITRGFIF